MMVRRLLVGIGASLIATIVPGRLGAFELLRVGRTCGDSQHLFWQPPVARIDYADLALDYRLEAEQARQRWNGSVRGFRFDFGSGTFCDVADGVSSLGFSGTDCGGANLGSALAVTRLRWDDDTGRLLDADVVFNANAGLLTDADVFLQVAMHELGHVLGLDHSDACGDSGAGTLMRSRLDRAEPRIDRPTADDIEGANFIYAPAGNGNVPDGGNSCAVVPVAAGWEAAIGFLLVPMLLCARRCRRVHRARAIACASRSCHRCRSRGVGKNCHWRAVY